MSRAVVSGRYANVVTRGVALAADIGVLFVGYAAGVAVINVLLDFFFDTKFHDNDHVRTSVVFALWNISYFTFTTAVAGRTLGKALVGLRVVRTDGSPVGALQSFVRSLGLLITAPLILISAALIVLNRRHRSLHDMVTGTVVVYDWGERPAELSAPLTSFLRERDTL